MLTKIGLMTVQVKDQDTALEFYTKLGLEKRLDLPILPLQRLEVAPPHTETRVLIYKRSPEMPGAVSYDEALSKIGTQTGAVLETDDIVKNFAELKKKGVPILDEPKKQSCGWWGVFADQDGNSYGVHQ